MAGTIFGLGLSQRVTSNGKPDIGWLLYLYAANTSTPVTAYKDTGLTAGLEHPWPIQADASGMMPAFWLADGSYRARATSQDGSRTFFDMNSVLALGPSDGGGGGGGGGVDATAIFQTGDPMFLEVTGPRSGWVRDNGRTIGSATSGATERANSDCQSLYEFYWNNFDDTTCPVVGGRGANAGADWSANKQITTIDKRGSIGIGLDDMGNSAASRFASVPFAHGNATTAGSICGENGHTLSAAEIPSLSGTTTATDTQSTWHYDTTNRLGGSSAGFTNIEDVGPNPGGGGQANVTSTVSIPTLTVSVNSSGGGGAHNTVPRAVTGTWYRKL